jgi:hypothetical protein
MGEAEHQNPPLYLTYHISERRASLTTPVSKVCLARGSRRSAFHDFDVHQWLGEGLRFDFWEILGTFGGWIGYMLRRGFLRNLASLLGLLSPFGGVH